MNNPIKITSRDNQRLKEARKVRDGKIEELIFIEGRRISEEAVRSGIDIIDSFVSEEFAGDKAYDDLLSNLYEKSQTAGILTKQVFQSITATETPQGIILIGKKPRFGLKAIENEMDSGNTRVPVVMYIWEVNNPSNLGAALRTAEAAGCAGVITSPRSADAYSEKAIRASMGSCFRLPVCRNVEPTNAEAWAAGRGLRLTAAATNSSQILYDVDWTVPRLLILGSEARGLENADFLDSGDSVSIPMNNAVESLNLAVSAGIILFEAVRQNEFNRP